MKLLSVFALIVAGATIISCSRESSKSTGWAYNNMEQGGFQKVPFVDQETGPGLVLVEGGTFTMGMVEQDVMFDWNNRPARVTVSSFYMDQTEVTNFDWTEYMTGYFVLMKLTRWCTKIRFRIRWHGEVHLRSMKNWITTCVTRHTEITLL